MDPESVKPSPRVAFWRTPREWGTMLLSALPYVVSLTALWFSFRADRRSDRIEEESHRTELSVRAYWHLDSLYIADTSNFYIPNESLTSATLYYTGLNAFVSVLVKNSGNRPVSIIEIMSTFSRGSVGYISLSSTACFQADMQTPIDLPFTLAAGESKKVQLRSPWPVRPDLFESVRDLQMPRLYSASEVMAHYMNIQVVKNSPERLLAAHPYDFVLFTFLTPRYQMDTGNTVVFERIGELRVRVTTAVGKSIWADVDRYDEKRAIYSDPMPKGR